MVEAAQRQKGTYLREKKYRVKARRGAKRAVVTIAHKILLAVYHMLSQQVSYNDLGDLFYLDRLNKQHLTRSLVRRLERLGWSVGLQQAATVSCRILKRGDRYFHIPEGSVIRVFEHRQILRRLAGSAE